MGEVAKMIITFLGNTSVSNKKNFDTIRILTLTKRWGVSLRLTKKKIGNFTQLSTAMWISYVADCREFKMSQTVGS